MKISAIWAMSENRVIGKNGQLPWHLPGDLKRFKKLTLGHPVIMGRKTFVSIGKPLPYRLNIVITRQPHFSAQGVQTVHSFEEAIRFCTELQAQVCTSHHVRVDAHVDAHVDAKTSEVFVIGGAEIYRQALPVVDRIYLTLIHRSIEGDTLFPEFDPRLFLELSRESQEEPIPHSFLILDRI